MPTYEYHCQACGHEFDRFQKMSDKPVRTCPECGKRSVVRRISSGGGVVFKGPGFYATDYRKGPAPGARSETSESSGEAKPGGEESASRKPSSKGDPGKTDRGDGSS